MIPNVELMTVKEFEEALEGYLKPENIPVINYILTRRNFPNCFPYSNHFIASKTGVPQDIVAEIDTIDFKPLYQFFSILSAIELVGRIFPTPWTGIYLIEKSAIDFSHFNDVLFLKGRSDDKVISYNIIIDAGAWMLKASELNPSYCIFRKSDLEVRVDQNGFKELPKYITLTSFEEIARFHIMMIYVSKSGIVMLPIDSLMSTVNLTDINPIYEIMKSDDWKMTPSLFWSNKFEAFKQKASDLMPKTREESIRIVSGKFKEDIATSGSFDVFMEEYFPKMSLATVAAYCLINNNISTEQVEQPA